MVRVFSVITSPVWAVELDRLVLHFNTEATFQHEEQLVLVVVTVPRQAAFDFRDFHIRVVDFTHDARRPMLRQSGGSVSKSNYLGHACPLSDFVSVLLGLRSRVCERVVEQLDQCIPIEGVGLSLVELHELLDLGLDGDVGLLTFGDDHVASLRGGL
jgi:hypothetical protein